MALLGWLFFAGWVLVWGVGIGFAVDFDFDVSGVTGELQTAGSKLFGWVCSIVSYGLFGIAIWMFVEGYINKQLGTKWFAIIGIAFFAILLRIFPKMYSVLTGVTVNQ